MPQINPKSKEISARLYNPAKTSRSSIQMEEKLRVANNLKKAIHDLVSPKKPQNTRTGEITHKSREEIEFELMKSDEIPSDLI